MLRKPRASDIALILLVVIIWASAFQAIKIAAPEVGALWTAAIRTWLGLGVLLPYALWRGWLWPEGGRQWLLLCVLAFLNVVLPFTLISWAETTISSSLTALLMGAGPMWALLLSHVMTDDDKLNVYKTVGVVLGFAGVALVVGKDALAGAGGQVLPQLAAFVGSLCYVVSGVLVRKVRGLPPARLSTFVLALASVQFALLVALRGAPMPSDYDTAAVWALLYLGLVPTGLAYLIRYYLINTIGYSYLALGINLLPVFGVILGALILDEPITLTMIGALGLILLGLAIARRGTGVSASAPPAPARVSP